MISQSERENARKRAASLIARSQLPVRGAEIASMEIADFGLGNLVLEGAQIATLIESPRLTAKLIVLFPGQTLPEHFHQPVGNDPGKEETVRLVWGRLSVCIPGNDGVVQAAVPSGKEKFYTCRTEKILSPGEQVYLPPGMKHWFQAGPDGAVALSISSVAHDALDPFTDPSVIRKPS